MLLFFLYACLRLLIDLALAPLGERAADQAELLLLRHEVRVLERHVNYQARWTAARVQPRRRLTAGRLQRGLSSGLRAISRPRRDKTASEGEAGHTAFAAQ